MDLRFWLQQSSQGNLKRASSLNNTHQQRDRKETLAAGNSDSVNPSKRGSTVPASPRDIPGASSAASNAPTLTRTQSYTDSALASPPERGSPLVNQRPASSPAQRGFQRADSAPVSKGTGLLSLFEGLKKPTNSVSFSMNSKPRSSSGSKVDPAPPLMLNQPYVSEPVSETSGGI